MTSFSQKVRPCVDFTSKAGNTKTVGVYNNDRANSKQLENMSEVFSWALILRLM